MTPTEHKKRHQELHRALDELVADWILHTGRRPSACTVMDLMQWAFQQAEAPTEDPPLVIPPWREKEAHLVADEMKEETK